jgi:hypothetical protein
MALFDFLFGKGDSVEKVPNISPEQQNLLSSILSQLGLLGGSGGNYGMAQNRLGELLQGDQSSYDRFSDPYLRQYHEEILPQLAEHYAGRGALGSSGFAQSLGAAGAGLQERLAALRGGLQQNAIGTSLGQYNQLAGLGLGTQPFNYLQREGSAGFVPTTLGNAFGGYLGKRF